MTKSEISVGCHWRFYPPMRSATGVGFATGTSNGSSHRQRAGSVAQTCRSVERSNSPAMLRPAMKLRQHAVHGSIVLFDLPGIDAAILSPHLVLAQSATPQVRQQYLIGGVNKIEPGGDTFLARRRWRDGGRHFVRWNESVRLCHSGQRGLILETRTNYPCVNAECLMTNVQGRKMSKSR